MNKRFFVFIPLLVGLPHIIVGGIILAGWLLKWDVVPAGMLWMGFGFLGGGLLFASPTFFFGAEAFRRIGAAEAKVASEELLRKTGRSAVGVVTQVKDTGAMMGLSPLVDVALEISSGGRTFSVSKPRVAFSMVNIPRVGDRYPVYFDPANPQHCLLEPERLP